MLTDDLKQTIRENLINFRYAVLVNAADEVKSPDFHYRWSDILLNGKGHVAIEGYRESGKSQVVLRAFPLYCLAYPDTSRDYILLIKNNATGAQNKLKEIIREYESNPMLRHNLVKIVEATANALSVDVMNEAGEVMNVRIEAYGKGSSVRGLTHNNRRPKLVVCDDLQDIEDVRSDVVQENDWQWFLGDIAFLGANTRLFVIGNNLGERCIVERIFADSEALGFDCERVPVEVGGVPTWPQRNSIEDIEKEKSGYKKIGKLDIWMRERLCVAVADENRLFHKEDFRYFCLNAFRKKLQECSLYMTVDPAASTENDSDYRCCLVTAVDHTNNWFLIDCSYGRYDTVKLMDEIFRLVTTWELTGVGIEKGVLKSAIEPFILKEMSKRNVFFNVEPLDHGGRKKVDRIRMLAPRFKAHTIWFPEDSDWVNEMEAELMAMTMQGSKGLHDDLADCLAYNEQICSAPYRHNQKADLQRQAIMN